MFTISKRFDFSASHQLDGLPDDHPCSRLHGHNYSIEIELASTELNDVGFVFDYRALDPLKTWIDETFDHRNLNDVVMFNPTAELLASFVFARVLLVLDLPMNVDAVAVRVYETPKTCAEYRANVTIHRQGATITG